jgi:tRNA 2-thiouridine synthesizing protein A
VSETAAEQAPDQILDARDLKCPLPVLKARRAMKPMAAGAVLRVEASDPGSVEDFAHFCEATGHELVAQSEAEGLFIHVIRKAG